MDKKVKIKFENSPNAVPTNAVIEFEELSEVIPGERDSLCKLTPSARGVRTKPDWSDTEKSFLFPQNDETEYVDTGNQINHDVLPGSLWQPHVHIIQNQDVVPQFKYKYRILNLGQPPSAWVEVLIDTAVYPYDDSGAMVNIIKIAERIDDGLVGKSTNIQGELRRVTGDGYVGDLIVTDVDIHYLADGIGYTFG